MEFLCTKKNLPQLGVHVGAEQICPEKGTLSLEFNCITDTTEQITRKLINVKN